MHTHVNVYVVLFKKKFVYIPGFRPDPIGSNLIFVCVCVLHLVFLAVCGLSLVAASRGYSSLRCMGSLQWLLLLRSTGSRHVGFSSCSMRAQ